MWAGTGRRNDFEKFTGRLKRDIGISLAVRLRSKQTKNQKCLKGRNKEEKSKPGWLEM